MVNAGPPSPGVQQVRAPHGNNRRVGQLVVRREGPGTRDQDQDQGPLARDQMLVCLSEVAAVCLLLFHLLNSRE